MSLWDFLFPPVCPSLWGPVATQGIGVNLVLLIYYIFVMYQNKFLHYVEDVCVLAEYRGGLKSIIYDVKFNRKKEQSKGGSF